MLYNGNMRMTLSHYTQSASKLQIYDVSAGAHHFFMDQMNNAESAIGMN